MPSQKKHDPSFYRGLIRELKSKKGRHPKKLLGDARSIQDPYYASIALLRISDDPRIPISEARLVAREAIRLADHEKRLWRRAELYEKLAKHAKSWNIEFSENDSQNLLDLILEKLEEFPRGKGLSQYINDISKHLGCNRICDLLSIAVSNDEFMLDDSKSVIRQWATNCSQNIPPNSLFKIITSIDDDFLQAKILGYFYLQCAKKEIDFHKALETALSCTKQLNQNDKIVTLRYLTRILQNENDFLLLSKEIQSLKDISDQVALFSTLAGRADKKDLPDLSNSLFTESYHKSKQINEEKIQEKEQMKIAKGLLKIDHKNKAKEILVHLHQRSSNNLLKNSIEKTMNQYQIQSQEIQSVELSDSYQEIETKHLPTSTGFSLGLFDTYEGSIKSIHIRSIARAAPLCAAFGLDLVLIGFPIKNLSTFIKKTVNNTTIGQGGKYLQFLYKENRIQFLNSIKDTNLEIIKDHTIIATTAHPDEKKSITINDLFKEYQKNEKKKVIVVMGLGKKGLPHSFLNESQYHYELTGNNVSLETCTVMGIIAERIQNQFKK